MSNTLEISITKVNIKTLTQLAILLSIAILAPLIHYQPSVGPTVNAALFIATGILGIRYGVLVALIPSPIALMAGLLPSPLAPMVPFIMISNVILVYTFGKLWNKNYWQAMVSASVLKFLFLWFTSSQLLEFFTKQAVAKNIATMMSWPQLFTALSGGLIAYGVLRYLKLVNKPSKLE
ncbi:iron hydrogenase [Patescibacteria group bacterium]|nr:iron hydrogenase [Patescibacteria group bacterium]